MADIDLQKTGETGAERDGSGRFRKGRSGNPAGRPRGSINPATRGRSAVARRRDRSATRKAVAVASAGDPVALRLCLERVIGVRRGRPVELALPPIASVGDLAAAMGSVADAAAQGAITPEEAVALSQMVETFTRTLQAVHVERRQHWRGKLWRQWAERARRAALRKKQHRPEP